MTKELGDEVVAAAMQYEAAWNRYSHVHSKSDSWKIILDKAEAHQRLLIAVRGYRDWIQANEQG